MTKTGWPKGLNANKNLFISHAPKMQSPEQLSMAEIIMAPATVHNTLEPENEETAYPGSCQL